MTGWVAGELRAGRNLFRHPDGFGPWPGSLSVRGSFFLTAPHKLEVRGLPAVNHDK